MVIGEIEDGEVRELAQLQWDGARQLVVGEVEDGEVWKLAQRQWGMAGQAIGAEVDLYKGVQVAKVGTNALQVIAAELEGLQAGEAAELRREFTTELVLPEIKFDDATVGGGGDAVPVGEGGVAEPVGVVGPAGAVGGEVERRQDGAFGGPVGPVGLAGGEGLGGSEAAEELVAIARVDDVAHIVAEEAKLDGLGGAGVVFEDGGLEVLADEAGGGAGDVEDGAGIVVGAGVGLGVAKGLHAPEGGEEVEEAGGGAIEGEVGDAVAPGAEFEAGLVAEQMGFDAEID